MNHKLHRVAELVYDTPVLADKKTLSSVIAYLQERNSEGFSLSQTGTQGSSGAVNTGEVGVATMSIAGPLTTKVGLLESLCGDGSLSSYESINAAMDEVVAHGGVHTLAVMYDTGGGMALNSFACAERLRRLADENNIRLVSFIEGSCNSAGYVLACTAHEIVMMDDNATSVGSIGALVALRNEIPKDMAEGTEVVFISSGEDKVPFDDEGKFKSEFLEDIRLSVDLLREDFISHVVKHRDMSEKQVRDTEAKSYQPDKALSLGLVDRKLGSEEFFDYLADLSSESGGIALETDTHKLKMYYGDSEKMTDETKVELAELEALKVQMAEMSSVLESQKGALELAASERDALLAAKAEKEQAELSAKLDEYSFSTEGVVALMSGMDAEAKGVLLGSLDSAQEQIVESEAEKDKAEDKADAEMFSQKGESGETADLGVEATLKAAVAEKLKKA